MHDISGIPSICTYVCPRILSYVPALVRAREPQYRMARLLSGWLRVKKQWSRLKYWMHAHIGTYAGICLTNSPHLTAASVRLFTHKLRYWPDNTDIGTFSVDNLPPRTAHSRNSAVCAGHTIEDFLRLRQILEEGLPRTKVHFLDWQRMRSLGHFAIKMQQTT